MLTSLEPSVTVTGRYSVEETCRILTICRDTLRKYTTSGAIKCGFRRENARKFYLGSEILRFWKAQM